MSSPGDPLSVRQRKYTRSIHAVSGTVVAAKLLLVLNDTHTFGKAVSCFYPIVCAVEELVNKHSDHPQLSKVHKVLQETSRVAAFEQDLAFLLGPDWRSQVCKTDAVKEYVSILQETAEKDPLLLAAYYYGLWVGFGSGGQILRKRIIKHLNLPEDKGTQLFFFKQGVDQAKGAIKAMFDSLGAELDEPARLQLLQTSSRMFQLNNKVIATFPISSTEVFAFAKKVAFARWMVAIYVAVASVVLLWLATSTRGAHS